MPLNEKLHEDRERAESFGSVAEAYDRYRPGYPDALVSDLAQLAPARVLDIACGTGKIATALVACGLAVLGVEIDPKMAAIARSHGLIVEQAAFEDWDDDGRTFDMITCGQAWHWIDQRVGAEKAARLLNPGGTLALFWNHETLDDDAKAELDEVYRKHAPELVEADRGLDDSPFPRRLEETGKFASVTTHVYKWPATISAEEFVNRSMTYSNHILLPRDRREALGTAMREMIDARGGTLALHFRTYTIFARTPESAESAK